MLVGHCATKYQEVPIRLAQCLWGFKIPIELARQFLKDMKAALF